MYIFFKKGGVERERGEGRKEKEETQERRKGKSKNQKWPTSCPDLSTQGPVLIWLFFFFPPKEDRIIRFSNLSVLFGR